MGLKLRMKYLVVTTERVWGHSNIKVVMLEGGKLLCWKAETCHAGRWKLVAISNT